MEYIVREGQNILDVALLMTGSVEGAVMLCLENNLSLTETLADGMSLSCSAVTDADVVRRYSVQDISPATALTADDAILAQGGIDFMGIEIDFIVS